MVTRVVAVSLCLCLACVFLVACGSYFAPDRNKDASDPAVPPKGDESMLDRTVGPATQANQRVERDIPYGSDAAQRLDLFTPATKDFATVIFVHGGSLTDGDKNDTDYRHVCEPFPAAGFACASINYRLAPTHAWPAPADDVAAATAWVRRNIAPRGGDPARIVLFGHSSGAMLVALVASDERYLAAHTLEPSDLKGVIAMGSIMWDDDLEQAIAAHGLERVRERWAKDPGSRMYASLEAFRDGWPMRHVKRGLPPFLFLIAESEQENPPVLKTNRAFVEKSRAAGNRADYEVLMGRRHVTAIRPLHEPGDAVFARILAFLRK